MMRRIKYILFVLTVFIIFPINSYAFNTVDAEISLLDVEVKVNKDRTIDVKEKYKIYFAKDLKSITRHLEKNVTQSDINNTKKLVNAKITNITSSIKSQIKDSSKYKDIVINLNGKQDETKELEISYKYNLGKDTDKSIDELYYNIVNNIEIPISNLVFTITFPDNMESKQIHFSMDDNYDLSDHVVTYDINDNQLINGKLNDIINANHKFSIYVAFPNNTFKGGTDNFNYLNIVVLLLPIVCLIYLILMYLKYALGNKFKVNRTNMVPNNFDPAEIAYLFKGKTEEMDLITVLIYLANEGYLKIVEHDDGYKLGKENTFKFIKLKDYDRNNAAQEIIFTNLFRDKDEVELQDIEYRFADTLYEAKSMLDNKDNNEKLFFKDMPLIKLISSILIALTSFAINFKPLYLYTNNILLVILIDLVILLGIYILIVSNNKGILKLILGGGIILVSIYVGITSTIVQTQLFIIYIAGLLMLILACVIYYNLSERTKYGNEMLGNIYGFKYYLDTLTREEIAKKQEENSNFYYAMVPYAYVLGSLDLWTQKGGNIVKPPEWYIPSSEFRMSKFRDFIKNVLYTTALVMMKQAYSQSALVKYENTSVKTNLND